jgi:hypothetical protein
LFKLASDFSASPSTLNANKLFCKYIAERNFCDIKYPPRVETTMSRIERRMETKLSIKDQLLELKELETAGLITSEDYEHRKAEILVGKQEKSIKDKFIELRKLKEEGFIGYIDYENKKRDLLDEDYETERKRNIKEVLAEYLELRDEGFITYKDYDYKKRKLLREF